jgi:hypothetical protein
MIMKNKPVGTVGLWLAVFSVFFLSCRKVERETPDARPPLQVDVQVDKNRPDQGEAVGVEVVVRSAATSGGPSVKASLLVPSRGVRDLSLRAAESADKSRAVFRGEVTVGRDFPEGLYVITAEAARGSQKAYGKGSFLLGKVVGDFMVTSVLPAENLEKEIRRYFEDFRGVGGNMVTIHNIISEKAWYPSRVCAKAAEPETSDDKVGAALRLAREYGLAAFLSVSWDMTRPMPYSECLESSKKIIAELWDLYGANPSLLGFYSYQEGSGTYLASQMREFAAAVKSHNRGLLTSCAPYIDDPLLAGYLAAIDDLDMVIYQGAVMASYRKDNRKCFPLRRTKDFTGLSAGATMQRGKITLSHVELFGYLEKQFAGAYLAGREDIYSQILSAATCHGPDGIVFFTYHYNIHELGKKIPQVADSRRGVEEGMKAYALIAAAAASGSSRVGLYIPYSDWWTDRWTNAIVPSLDACRRLGLSPDIIPFLPPKGEDVLPYYPYHLNEEQLDFLLRNNYVLVLSDIAGMQDTDSLLLKNFVEKGGVGLLFGPSIPYGDQYDRDQICGGRENPARAHSMITIKEALGHRAGKGARFGLAPAGVSSWSPENGKAVAVFEDGSAAALLNEFGRGFCLTIPLRLGDAVSSIPDFIRDVLDFALERKGMKRAFDLIGAGDDLDVAMTMSGGRRVVAVVNHRDAAFRLAIRPLHLRPEDAYQLADVRTGRTLRTGSGRDFAAVEMEIPGRDYILLSLSEK